MFPLCVGLVGPFGARSSEFIEKTARTSTSKVPRNESVNSFFRLRIVFRRGRGRTGDIVFSIYDEEFDPGSG